MAEDMNIGAGVLEDCSCVFGFNCFRVGIRESGFRICGMRFFVSVVH